MSCRVRVFIDFWNYTSNMKRIDQRIKTDWEHIGPALTRKIPEIIKTHLQVEFQGLNVYGSYDPHSQKNLLTWAEKSLGKVTGASVYMGQRREKKNSIHCKQCRHTINYCPKCNKKISSTEEKGIDVRMAVDMIKFAWVDNYDVAILVSDDTDFIPVAELLGTKGIKVVHATFSDSSLLTYSCWAKIDMRTAREFFEIS
ncbi:MAG: NYN domain-containing protein [Bacteroidetes bacterium]|nr:NYN domain-containing protein [Bacteroidota bacterium]